MGDDRKLYTWGERYKNDSLTQLFQKIEIEKPERCVCFDKSYIIYN